MHWFVVLQVVSVLFDWLKLARLSDQEKDLEILLLRQQLAILQRKQLGPHRDIWHRYWVGRKWNHSDKWRVGRPRTRKDLEQLIARLADTRLLELKGNLYGE